MDYEGIMEALPPEFRKTFQTLEVRFTEAVLDDVNVEDAVIAAQYLICLKWLAGLTSSRDRFLKDPKAQNPTGLIHALNSRAKTYDGLATALDSLAGLEPLIQLGAKLSSCMREVGELDRKLVSDLRLNVQATMRQEREKSFQDAATRLNEAVRSLVEAVSEYYAPGIAQTLLLEAE